MVIFAFNLFNSANAQVSRPAALVLTDSFSEQYLAPYLKKHNQPINEGNTDLVLRSHRLEGTSHFNGSSYRSSIIPLGLDGQALWVSFEALNKSNSENWFIDLGHYFSGRFGLLKNIDVFITNFDGEVLYKETINNKQSSSAISLVLPKDKRSIISIGLQGHAGIPTTLPLKLASISAKERIDNSRKDLQTYVLFGLIGMVFFFMSLCVSQSSPAYTFFAAYYIILCLMTLVEAQLFFFVPVASALVIPALLTLLAMASLITIKILWDEIEESETLNTIFKAVVIILGVSPLIAFALPAGLSFPKAVLFFGPCLLTMAIVPPLSLLQSQHGKQDEMPFVFGWFFFLCGLGISALAISGLMPPLPATLNAFWYALIPQAALFIYALHLKSKSNDTNVSHAKTMEIIENENVNKFRQSKELAEQERLMKVIEQERKVLGELRKSEARRAEEMRVEKERADDANRAKSAFLAVVSHEIRTPMSGIMGMVKMLLDSSLDKQQKEYAQTIQDSSDAMLALLNDILDFEKVEQGKMEIENIGIDLPRLIQGVATLMNGHATQKNIKLVTDIDEKLPRYVKGDPTRLRQVLLNLTGNAIKFTEEGSVTI
ncbi:MAG: hypothetical protein HRT94_06340 [Alphaproteobacteria bacterium]|nr:hypothetical protein [Alphaproteobacteria bacterium]